MRAPLAETAAAPRVRFREEGVVREARQDIARVAGFAHCVNGALVEIPPVARGLIMGFVEGEALVFLLGGTEAVRPGLAATSDMAPFTVPVGDAFVGRLVNALAQPMDGRGAVAADGRGEVFREAPAVLDRVPLSEPFHTGILILDAAVPIGKGQRELVIGDRMTGKTAVGVDAILNQRGEDILCIYCSIGNAHSALHRVVETLKLRGALDYTVVVAAGADAPSGEKYLAPYTACALGEHFLHRGRDVFVVFDDLTKHAWAYRQLSLLLERSPGRDAYPGDIFYLHSQLMERAASLRPEQGGGTMTFFPVVETLQGDIAGYVPSNLVSMTDGQIYLSANLFAGGQKPAVDLTLSVSRIGSKVQSPAMKKMSGMLRLEYLQYQELLKLTRFKTGMTDDIQGRLKRGEVITSLFLQDINRPRPVGEEILFLYALRRGVLDALSPQELEFFKAGVYAFAREQLGRSLDTIHLLPELSEEVEASLDQCLLRFFKTARPEEVWTR